MSLSVTEAVMTESKTGPGAVTTEKTAYRLIPSWLASFLIQFRALA